MGACNIPATLKKGKSDEKQVNRDIGYQGMGGSKPRGEEGNAPTFSRPEESSLAKGGRRGGGGDSAGGSGKQKTSPAQGKVLEQRRKRDRKKCSKSEGKPKKGKPRERKIENAQASLKSKKWGAENKSGT